MFCLKQQLLLLLLTSDVVQVQQYVGSKFQAISGRCSLGGVPIGFSYIVVAHTKTVLAMMHYVSGCLEQTVAKALTGTACMGIFRFCASAV